MYVSPNHPNPPRPQAPPEDSCRPLAVFPRPGNEEVRLGISHFNNRDYLRAQMWAENERGEWWPLRGRSITWRADELPDLVASLRAAIEAIDRPAPEAAAVDEKPTYVERRRPGRYDPRDLQGLPAAAAGDEAFNEFREQR